MPRLVSCDLKSISYLNSQLPLLLDNKFNANKQYKAASNVAEFQTDVEINEKESDSKAWKIKGEQGL